MRSLTISDPALVGRQTYEQTVLADSPTGYWPLGEGSTDSDHSGSGRNLTWSGTTPTSTQILPTAAGGITAAGASLARWPASTTNAAFTGTNVYTFEAWVKFTSTSDIAILSHRNTNEHYAIYHDNTNKLRIVKAYSSGFNVEGINTGIALNDGNLHHVVVLCNGGTSWQVYVDGASAGSGAPTQSWSESGSADYLTIGSEVGPARRWVGQLGHVAIYRGALLSAARIAAHHTRGRT